MFDIGVLSDFHRFWFPHVSPKVGNLPYSTSWQDLKDHMRKAGDVLFCEILQEPGTATGMGKLQRSEVVDVDDVDDVHDVDDVDDVDVRP